MRILKKLFLVLLIVVVVSFVLGIGFVGNVGSLKFVYFLKFMLEVKKLIIFIMYNVEVNLNDDGFKFFVV